MPLIVKFAAENHNVPFFSVDVAQLETGEDIIIEIGDGQVSDIKMWDVESFYKIFL